MANKKTRALTQEEYTDIIKTMRTGFAGCRANDRAATILVLEANIGVRVSDILELTPESIVRDGGRYRLDITEIKTGKKRTFTVPTEIYLYFVNYCMKNDIKKGERVFPISERAVQKVLAKVADYLNIDGISTHSFRKFFATNIYINNGYDIALVQQLLQHSSPETTARYVGVGTQKLETALKNNINLL